MIDEHGPRPSAFRSALGKPRRDVDPRERIGSVGDLLARLQRGLGQVFEVRCFGGERVRPSLCYLQRQIVQFGCVEAHYACQRLAMGKAAIGRHQPVGGLRRHFNMIAEHAIMLDLKVRNPGFVAIARFERRQRSSSASAGRAQIVERGVIAFGDETALIGIDRRVGHQRAR